MKRTSEAGAPGPAGRAGPVDRWLSALSLVSGFPVPFRFRFDPSGLDFHLPLVGVAVAAATAGSLLAAALLFRSAYAAAFCALFVQYRLFNLFHLDGLVDTADALEGGSDAQRCLEILKDPRVGTYGLFAGFCALAAKLGLLAATAARLLEGGASPWTMAAVLAYPVAGRAAAAAVPALLPPAREGGLGRMAAGSRLRRTFAGSAAAVAAWVVLCTAAILVSASLFAAALPVAPDLPFVLACAALPLGAAASTARVVRGYGKKIGGYTGDALGAAVELGELAALALGVFALGL